MQLTKYCRPEHNIRDGCTTTRFGSFKYYREMEADNPLADYDEGVHTITYGNLHGTLISQSVIDAHQPAVDKRIFEAANAGSNVVIAGNSLRTIYKNHFMWCCGIDEGRSPDNNYTSNYKIEDIGAFGIEMAAILGENLTKSDLVTGPVEQPPCVALVGFKIAYVESRQQTLTSLGLDYYCHQLPQTLWPYGIKNTKYSHEKEFRLMFIVHDGANTEYEVAQSYKDCLVTDKLRQLVS